MRKIMEVEIKGYGAFKVKHDYLHRERSRLVLFDEGRFKEIQYDSYDSMFKDEIYQKGIDLERNEIYIKILR